jgi:hypothetical protein
MPNPSEFGITVSQQGIPVERAADSQKVLDSDWKFLDVVLEEHVEAGYSAFDTTAVYKVLSVKKHGLGHPPAFLWQLNRVSTALFGETPSFEIVADDENLYVGALLSTNLLNTPFFVDLDVTFFSPDFTKEFTAPVQQAVPFRKSEQSDYGLETLLPEAIGRGIQSTRVEDFGMTSQAKALGIQKHGIVQASGGVISITHNFGAPPFFMLAKYYPEGQRIGAFGYPFGQKPMVSGINIAEGTGRVTKDILVLGGAQYALQDTDKYAYILLKEPLSTAL